MRGICRGYARGAEFRNPMVLYSRSSLIGFCSRALSCSEAFSSKEGNVCNVGAI